MNLRRNPTGKVFLLFVFLALPAVLRGQSNGWLRLTFPERPAAVWVDSLSLKPPRADTLLSLPAGEHTVRAQTPRRELWNLRDFQKSVFLKTGDTLTLRVQFPRYVLLLTTPAGAGVEQGRRSLGKTPLILSLEQIQAGPLILKKAGFLSRTVQPSQIQSGHFWLKLTADSTYWVLQKKKRRQALLHRRRLYRTAAGLALTAAGSGALSYFFKQRANRFYNHYLHTPFPEDIRKSYNEAHKFDTYAGTSYLFFEINLIGSTYFILRALSSNLPEQP